MKVTLTYSEAVEMLKKAYYPSYLSINENVGLEIEPDVTVAVTEDNPWIDVPKDWCNWWCPSGKDFGKVEIYLRNGETDTGPSSDWDAIWDQDNNPYDIVKYRKAI